LRGCPDWKPPYRIFGIGKSNRDRLRHHIRHLPFDSQRRDPAHQKNGKSEVTETPIDLASIMFDPPLEEIIADAALSLVGEPDEAAVMAVRNVRANMKKQLPDFPGKAALIEESVVSMLSQRADIQNACGPVCSTRH
jgi:hypothetical protein